MFQIKVAEKIKTHFMFSDFFPKLVSFMRLCQKIRWRQISQTIWLLRVLDKKGYTHARTLRLLCTDTHRGGRTRMSSPARARTHIHTHAQKYVILIAFPGNSCFVNAPQRYVTRTLPVLYYFPRGISVPF